MGFMDSMKAANLNFGKVDSADFAAAYITLKDDHFMIASAKETYEFYKQDVACFKPLSTGDNWIKWLMKFQDGKVAIITSDVVPPAQKGTGASVAPIERFFGDLLFAPTSAGTAQRQQPVQTSRVPTEQQPVAKPSAPVQQQTTTSNTPSAKGGKSSKRKPLSRKKGL